MSLSSFCASSLAEKWSPSVTNRLLSGACAMRQPTLLPPDGGPFWRKMTVTVSRRGAAPSSSKARATATVPPAFSLKQKKIVRFCAKLRSSATSSMPACPCAETFGTPDSGADNFPSRLTMRMRPGRSVTSIRPSGRKASAQGYSSPWATVSTVMAPAEELKVCALAVAGASSNRPSRAAIGLHGAHAVPNADGMRMVSPCAWKNEGG